MASQQQNSQERGRSLTESQLRSIAVESAQRLGYPTLKDEQLEAIVSFAQGNDCFIALPTGYGKSAIYGVLPYVSDTIKGMIYINMLYILNINKQLWFVVKQTTIACVCRQHCCVCKSFDFINAGSAFKVCSTWIAS